MKKIAILLLALSIMMSGCGYKSTTEHELLTIRGGVQVKDYNTTYVEISYQTNDGIVTTLIDELRIAVGTKSKVVLIKGEYEPTVFLSVEDYNKFYNLN